MAGMCYDPLVKVQSNKCVIWLRPQTMRMKLYVFMFYVLCLLFELVLKYEIYLKNDVELYVAPPFIFQRFSLLILRVAC